MAQENDGSQAVLELTSRIAENVDGPGQLCRVVIQNRTPPEWNATIIAVGTRFWYKNGGEFTDGPFAVNVPAGGETSTSNNDPTKCVGVELTGVTVHVPGHPDSTLQGQEQCPPGANTCLLGAQHILAPKGDALAKLSADTSLTDYLEIRTV